MYLSKSVLLMKSVWMSSCTAVSTSVSRFTSFAMLPPPSGQKLM